MRMFHYANSGICADNVRFRIKLPSFESNGRSFKTQQHKAF